MYLDRRRPADLSDPDVVHDAGDLPVYGTGLVRLPDAATSTTALCKVSAPSLLRKRHGEHRWAVHPSGQSPPRCRRKAIGVLLAWAPWAFTLLPVSPPAPRGFPNDFASVHSLPWREPAETMASFGRDAARTPLRASIAGITEITSTNVLGTTSITLQFDLDRDVDSAARDVQAAIAAAGGELPANLPFRPTYRKVNPSDSPVLILSMTSDTMPLAPGLRATTASLAQKILAGARCRPGRGGRRATARGAHSGEPQVARGALAHEHGGSTQPP